MHGSLPFEPARLDAFRKQYQFRPDRTLWLGVERECFLVDRRGDFAPRAADVVAHVHKKEWRRASPDTARAMRCVSPQESVGYELSAVQLETRTPPHQYGETEDYLRLIDIHLRNNLHELGLRATYNEVAPETMPLDIYPDPTGRYQAITQAMPREMLLAACRIIGTHVHVGMPDHETALRVHNEVIEHCDVLSDLGDGSGGERLRIYGIVKPDNRPRPYASWEDFHEEAYRNGFEEDPRSNWRMIRLTKHGTLEFRVFGATERVDRICAWTQLCYLLCKKALNRATG